MSEMIRVVAAIIEQEGRVLICQRPAGKAFVGKWEFPGGKMRPSETPRQALERELREELGVSARIGGSFPDLYAGRFDGGIAASA